MSLVSETTISILDTPCLLQRWSGTRHGYLVVATPASPAAVPDRVFGRGETPADAIEDARSSLASGAFYPSAAAMGKTFVRDRRHAPALSVDELATRAPAFDETMVAMPVACGYRVFRVVQNAALVSAEDLLALQRQVILKDRLCEVVTKAAWGRREALVQLDESLAPCLEGAVGPDIVALLQLLLHSLAPSEFPKPDRPVGEPHAL